MSKNNINSNEKKVIMEFEKLEDILGCKNCNKDCSYNPSNTFHNSPNSKYNCKRIMKKMFIIEVIIGIVIEALIISLSYVIFHNIMVSIIFAVLFLAIIFYLDEKFVNQIFKKIFVSKEEKRRKEYDIQVVEIKKQNEIIERQEKGETEEYICFRDKINEITQNIFEKIERLSDISNTANFMSVLEDLNAKIIPENFEYTYIQTFYNVHLPSLLNNISTFDSKRSEGNITNKECEALEKLFSSFNSRINLIINSLKEADEEEFIKKMNSLQEEIYKKPAQKEEN